MTDERPDVLLTDDIRELLQIVKDSDLAEVLIERGNARIRIRRAVPQQPIVNMVAQPISGGYSLPAGSDGLSGANNPAIIAPTVETSTDVSVTAPMVGTFYAAPSPKDPPYVRVGDEVRPGDVLGIIEAMKIMNEIECEVHGRVTRVLVENGQPVEYGQSLIVVDPIS